MSLKESYNQIVRHHALNENPNENEYNELTKMILSESPKNMIELLTLFKQKDNIKNSNAPTLTYVFNLYSLYLVETNDKESLMVLKKILKIITKLQEPERIRLTKFVWSCQGFCQLIDEINLPESGRQYMTDSIFSTMSDTNYQISDINVATECYYPLIDTMIFIRDTQIDKWNSFVKYIEHFFDANLGYTFDDPSRVGQYLSTFDYCVFVLNLLIIIMKRIMNDNKLVFIFWKAMHVVYLQIPIMRHRIGSSINLTKSKMDRSDDNQEKKELRDHYHRGIEMIRKLEKCIETIDYKYINDMMGQYTNYLIEGKQYDIMHGLIESYSYWSKILIKETQIISIIYSLISSMEVPIQIKFNATCLLLSHDLRNDFFCYKNGKKVMIDYIINDVNRLKEINKLYLIDLVIGLIETNEIIDMDTKNDQIDNIALNYGINTMVLSLLTDDNPVNMCENMDVLEKLLYVLPGIGGQYKDSLKCLSFQQRDNQKIVNSLTRMIKASTLMIRSLHRLGKNGLSYVDQVFEYIQTIIETKKHLILGEQEHEILLQTLNTLENKYIEMINPMICDMFNELMKLNTKIIINDNTSKICVQLIGITLPEKIKIIDYDTLSQEYKDVITCDLVINPYYITAGTEELYLVDRKTMMSLSETKVNPFTREEMSREMIEEFNNKTDIIEHRKLYQESLEKL